MKRFSYYIPVISILSLFLQGCSYEEALSDTDDAVGTPLTILVQSAGYVSSDNNDERTRVREEDDITRFTHGDKIGVFALNSKGAVIASCKNSPCTYNEGISGWTGNIYQYKDATYFAYYPYDASFGNEITSLDDIVSAFKAKLNSTTDQGTYEKFTALDLMTAAGVSPTEDNKLSFTLQHEMAMVQISMPKTKYSGDNNGYSWFIPAPNTTFDGFTPCRMPDCTYRYLIEPSTSKTLRGSYSNKDGNILNYSLSVNNIAAAQYKKYIVDEATVTEASHSFQVGDFYMNDGSLVAKGTELTEAQKEACIGVVFYLGKHSADGSSYVSTGIGQAQCHGYVIALVNAGSYSYGDVEKWGGWFDVDQGTTAWNGYSYQQDMLKRAKQNNRNFPSTNAALLWGKESNSTKYAAPMNSSGWFVPSAGQLIGIYTSRSEIETSLDSAGGSYSTTNHGSNSSNNASLCYYVNLNSGGKGAVSRGTNYAIRFILTF